MRKLTGLLVLVALLGAGAARATIGPPVQVGLLGGPRAAEPGVPYQGRLQIVSGVPARLDKFAFGGPGWTQLAIDAAASVNVEKDRALVIDFTAVTNDPDEWLEFSFEMDGHPITRQLNLSPARVAGLLGPGAVEKGPDEPDPFPLDDMTRISPGPALSEEIQQPQPEAGAKGRNIRVRGRFVYTRSDGFQIGADGVTVRVYAAEFGGGLLATTATNAQGWYDVTFYYTPCPLFCDENPDLYVNFEAANNKVLVEDASFFSNTYSWQTGVTTNYTGSDLNYGTLWPADPNQHPALHLLTDLVRTWRWFYSWGYDAPHVRANWPDGTTGAWYTGEIHISTGEQWGEHVHTHEWGHHWVKHFATAVSPDYCNGICDSPGNCGHCLWCRETDHDAFAEGFPDWMGDYIPSSFATSYGRAARFIYDMENLYRCGSSYHDPLLTEGFFGALIRDIGDSTNDDHPDYPETDELSLGWDEILACIDLDHPTTPMTFLNAFKARYPQHREGLWATAKNCGYEIDVLAPPTVTNLTSTSHSTSGDSPDPTIDFTWTRANDDVSGVRGYGIWISSSAGLPSAVQDIGDVTYYTTPSLAPGTYYFSIRTLDRAGRWGSGYAAFGPITIRAPVPANLHTHLLAGWSSVLVAREANNSTSGSVPAPVTLPGNSAGTYWNVGGRNSGEASTGVGFETRAYVDGTFRAWWSWGAIGAGGNFYGINGGPLNIRGGRHTFEARVDATDVVAETNEADNRWARQWIWTPYVLAANTPVTRAAPPLRTAGWEAIVDGTPAQYNSDGLRQSAPAWWGVSVLRPLSATADYDLRLHDPSTGASNGFGANIGSSGRVSGIDAVIVNHNRMGWGAAYDVGVINWNGNNANYELTHVTNQFLAHGDSVTVPFALNQMLRVWEIYVSPAAAGAVSVTVDTDPANGRLYALWFDHTFQTGGLWNASATAASNAAGRARLDLNIAEEGYYGLIVYRDPDWSKGTGPIDVTIEIQRTPPDFLPYLATGWHAPIVPRPANDGTQASVPAPATLAGNVATTYFNVAARNQSPTAWPFLPGHIHIDGINSAWVLWGHFPGYANGLFNWEHAWQIRGGRHTLAWRLDQNQEIEEIHEDNNVYGEQWVWSPLVLAMNVPVVRSAPPDPYGGWLDVDTGEVLWPNSDGLRLPDSGAWWRGVAVMPGAASDVDLSLHAASTGAKSGFGESLAGSYWWRGESDYVLVNFNATGFAAYDAGAIQYAGSEAFTVEATTSVGWIEYPQGTYGPYSLPAGRILNLYDVLLPAGALAVVVQNVSGAVDWGVTLHPAGLPYLGKSDAVPGGIAYAEGGPGQDETIVANVPTDGWYGIAVWKRATADLPLEGSYRLYIGAVSATGVPGGSLPPAVSALREIHPNPFNPQTRIEFDLARTDHVLLQIYDLRGTRVRTLVNESRGSGRHTAVWDGLDDGGRQLASGVYMARLVTGEVNEMKKMTLLK